MLNNEDTLHGFEMFEVPATGGADQQLRLKGVIDYAAAQALGQRLQEGLNSGWKQVQLDFAEVPIITSAGVSTIVNSIQDYRAESGDLILVHMSSEVCHVFELLKLLDYVTWKQ